MSAVLQAILLALQAVPSLLQAAAAIKGDLSATDLATLNDAIDAAQKAALADVAQAEMDLNAAALK